MTATDLTVIGGQPFTLRVRMKAGIDMWATLDLFEARMQVRDRPNEWGKLLNDLSDYLTTSYDGDDVLVDLAMTGQETRALRSGFYDMFVSDTGTTDTKAVRLLYGTFTADRAITAAASA